jgi:ribosomal-protein-alanine N-acetyltransferase
VVDEEAELETIAVAAEGQRRGMGRCLMEALAEELKAAGVRRIFLEARASNEAAEGLYRALGFIETGRRRGYYGDRQRSCDCGHARWFTARKFTG